MREIKFRAWDKYSKKMRYIVGFVDANGEIRIWYFNGETLINQSGQFDLLQFTGLKDKNGREIYEGDIITSGTSYNLEVFWMGLAWGVRWKDMGNDEEGIISDDGGDMGMDDNGNMKHMEVIGNIHDNPELLKG